MADPGGGGGDGVVRLPAAYPVDCMNNNELGNQCVRTFLQIKRYSTSENSYNNATDNAIIIHPGLPVSPRRVYTYTGMHCVWPKDELNAQGEQK